MAGPSLNGRDDTETRDPRADVSPEFLAELEEFKAELWKISRRYRWKFAFWLVVANSFLLLVSEFIIPAVIAG